MSDFKRIAIKDSSGNEEIFMDPREVLEINKGLTLEHGHDFLTESEFKTDRESWVVAKILIGINAFFILFLPLFICS